MKLCFHRENSLFQPFRWGGMEQSASGPAFACLAKKKLKAFNFRLADPQNRCLLESQRERSPRNEVLFSSRDSLFKPFRWATWSTLRSRNETAMEGAQGR
jgi:hypothetical protein